MASSRNSQKKSARVPKVETPSVPSKSVRQEFLAQVVPFVEEALASSGFELVLAQTPVMEGQLILRLFVEHSPAPEAELTAQRPAITLDDCVKASRAVDEVLESLSTPEAYLLEVSSPGLDRPLLKEADYHRFCGSQIALRINSEGKKLSVKGCLAKGSQGQWLVTADDGTTTDFTYEQVVSARLAL